MARSVMALALGTMLVATPVLAEGNSAPKADAKSSAASDKTRYCVKYDDLVGTRITKEECLTRKEWRAQGVDIDELLKQK